MALGVAAALLWFSLAGVQSRGSAAAPTGQIRLEPVASGLDNPVYVTHSGDDRLFVAEQPGRIRIVQAGRLLETPFLDISRKVSFGGERGLLGLAFHPGYRTNGRFFVNYTREPDGATIVAEYRVSADPSIGAPAERVLLVIPQPYPNHNGGMVEFGPDRFLYIGLGDGGAGGDPGNRAQNRQELLGKILRIDVDRGAPYGIPPDNPFASGGGRPEIFAWGLRNPWRFSFDRHTGQLWVGDVGQDRWEEVDVVRRGGNYGWRVMEGAHCFLPRHGCATAGLELPVTEYGHAAGRCSVIGGYVYRGTRIPSLVGAYVYGDYCSGEIFEFASGAQRVLLSTTLAISSFGEDGAGELYVVGLNGTVHRLGPASKQAAPASKGSARAGGPGAEWRAALVADMLVAMALGILVARGGPANDGATTAKARAAVPSAGGRKGRWGMGWVGWLLGVVAVIALFVLWDLLFCGGKRCGEFLDRM